MAGADKTDNKYNHDTTPPPSYEEVQMKDVVKTDKKDDKNEDQKEKEKDAEEKTEELVPPVGMLELVIIYGYDRHSTKMCKIYFYF